MKAEKKPVKVVRVLASHQCGAGSNADVGDVCWLSLLLVLSIAPKGFSGFPRLVKNQHYQIPIRPGMVDEESSGLCGCCL